MVETRRGANKGSSAHLEGAVGCQSEACTIVGRVDECIEQSDRRLAACQSLQGGRQNLSLFTTINILWRSASQCQYCSSGVNNMHLYHGGVTLLIHSHLPIILSYHDFMFCLWSVCAIVTSYGQVDLATCKSLPGHCPPAPVFTF